MRDLSTHPSGPLCGIRRFIRKIHLAQMAMIFWQSSETHHTGFCLKKTCRRRIQVFITYPVNHILKHKQTSYMSEVVPFIDIIIAYYFHIDWYQIRYALPQTSMWSDGNSLLQTVNPFFSR